MDSLNLNVIANMTPGQQARLAGVFYLFTIVAGMAGLALHGKAADAANLLAGLAYMAVTILFFYLFKPVSRAVSLVAGVLSLIGFSGSVFDRTPFGADSLVFFGVYCLLIACLIARSSFLPAFLAVLMALAGLNWLTYASPHLVKRMHPYNPYPGLIGEGAITLWLLFAGVNASRWHAQALENLAEEKRQHASR